MFCCFFTFYFWTTFPELIEQSLSWRISICFYLLNPYCFNISIFPFLLISLSCSFITNCSSSSILSPCLWMIFSLSKHSALLQINPFFSKNFCYNSYWVLISCCLLGLIDPMSTFSISFSMLSILFWLLFKADSSWILVSVNWVISLYKFVFLIWEMSLVVRSLCLNSLPPVLSSKLFPLMFSFSSVLVKA